MTTVVETLVVLEELFSTMPLSIPMARLSTPRLRPKPKDDRPKLYKGIGKTRSEETSRLPDTNPRKFLPTVHGKEE